MRASPFLSVLAVSAVALVGCARPLTGTASTTAGDVAAASPVAGNERAVAVEEASDPAGVPPGQLVCRAKSAVEGTSELYLEWNGEVAKGFVRRVVPSGMVYVQPVRAERFNSAIIADDPNTVDLVTHVAVVGHQDGKKYMRVGDRHQAWVLCE